jgi:hypothetical protein
VLSLYDPATGLVEAVTAARTGVVRVACAGGLRSLLVGDLIRRLAAHHRWRAIGIWETVPGAEGLGVRPAEHTSGEADVYIGQTVGACSFPESDGLDPMVLRMALLARHYRADIALTRADLDMAHADLTGLRQRVATWAESPGRPASGEYVEDAVAALDADLDTPAVFPMLSRLHEDEVVTPGAKFETAVKLDMILGLDLVALVGRR